MIRKRVGIALSVLSALGVLPAACHKAARAQRNGDVAPVINDTVRVAAPLTDPSVIALFKDTAASVFPAEGQIFKLQTPAQRQSLRAAIRKERELWQAGKPRDYRYLLRVGCFCPGTRGWLLMEVRSGKLLRAWDRTGKSVGLTDWNTVSIDGLYDNLERSADINGEAQIAFDSRWHFPRYVRTTALPGPDSWSITEARALRPI
ncbi:MAG: DUF6174 domain-containing protein [Gemmatimonadaceae bacterium]